LHFTIKIKIINVFTCFIHFYRNPLPGVIPYVLIAVFFLGFVPQAGYFLPLQLIAPGTLLRIYTTHN